MGYPTDDQFEESRRRREPPAAGRANSGTLAAISAEVLRARLKFPKNGKLLAALTEEVGELAKALLQQKPKEEIEKEAIQVAAVAIRIIEEGDADFADKNAWEAKP